MRHIHLRLAVTARFLNESLSTDYTYCGKLLFRFAFCCFNPKRSAGPFHFKLPITEQQIGECIVIGTTVDGDFLAVHPQTAGLLWLPRHAEHVKAISLQAREQEDEGMYALVLDEIYRQVYGISQEEAVYYEPWTGTRSHLFMRLPQGQDQLSLPDLAGMCQADFPPDLSIETRYACFLFYRQLGGYVRLNYAYQQEVVVFYEQDAGQAFAVMEQWLLSKGCEAISENNR